MKRRRLASRHAQPECRAAVGGALAHVAETGRAEPRLAHNADVTEACPRDLRHVRHRRRGKAAGLRRRHDRACVRMSARYSEAGRATKSGVVDIGSIHETWLAERQRAGLVEYDRIDLGHALETIGRLDE